MANLLVEAREALERANVIANAVAQCNAHLAEEKFEQAFAALDESLDAYPGDPRLVARRREVEERQKAFHSAAAVRGAIQEANWLLDHDRTDLAAQLLKQKACELPDQRELSACLSGLESLLPEWEEKRHVRDALARAFGELEQAERLLERALDDLGAEPALQALRNEIESGKAISRPIAPRSSAVRTPPAGRGRARSDSRVLWGSPGSGGSIGSGAGPHAPPPWKRRSWGRAAKRRRD